MTEARDAGHAAERWEFDGEVTRVFDDMLARSIPNYEGMRDAVDRMIGVAVAYERGPETTSFGAPRPTYLPGDGDIVDLGSSRGGAIAGLIEHWPDRQFHALETSKPMVAALHERFDGYPNVQVHEVDAREMRAAVWSRSARVVLSVLTLMFIPLDERQEVISLVYDTLRGGGSFIVVEKILGAGAPMDRRLVAAYHSLKLEHGYTGEEIERKRLSLQGVLVPLTELGNHAMLSQAGFREIECFWRWMNFAAWVAVK